MLNPKITNIKNYWLSYLNTTLSCYELSRIRIIRRIGELHISNLQNYHSFLYTIVYYWTKSKGNTFLIYLNQSSSIKHIITWMFTRFSCTVIKRSLKLANITISYIHPLYPIPSPPVNLFFRMTASLTNQVRITV